MGRKYLTAVTKYKHTIVGAKINGEEYEIDEIIRRMREKDDNWTEIYTFCDGFPTSKVFPKRNFWGTEFLCTSPDGILENNLSELEEF